MGTIIPFCIILLYEQQEIVYRVGMLFERADAIDREVAAAGRWCEMSLSIIHGGNDLRRTQRRSSKVDAGGTHEGVHWYIMTAKAGEEIDRFL